MAGGGRLFAGARDAGLAPGSDFFARPHAGAQYLRLPFQLCAAEPLWLWAGIEIVERCIAEPKAGAA